MLSKTYVQACLDGDANIFDLDDYIDYWHDNDTGVTLSLIHILQLLRLQSIFRRTVFSS